MSPQEISLHRMRWQRDGGYTVTLHSDLRSAGKDWLKTNLHMRTESWVQKTYTNNYEDSYYFEFETDAEAFRTVERFVPYVDLECI
jgi:hypothetical protein